MTNRVSNLPDVVPPESDSAERLSLDLPEAPDASGASRPTWAELPMIEGDDRTVEGPRVRAVVTDLVCHAVLQEAHRKRKWHEVTYVISDKNHVTFVQVAMSDNRINWYVLRSTDQLTTMNAAQEVLNDSILTGDFDQTPFMCVMATKPKKGYHKNFSVISWTNDQENQVENVETCPACFKECSSFNSMEYHLTSCPAAQKFHFCGPDPLQEKKWCYAGYLEPTTGKTRIYLTSRGYATVMSSYTFEGDGDILSLEHILELDIEENDGLPIRRMLDHNPSLSKVFGCSKQYDLLPGTPSRIQRETKESAGQRTMVQLNPFVRECNFALTVEEATRYLDFEKDVEEDFILGIKGRKPSEISQDEYFATFDDIEKSVYSFSEDGGSRDMGGGIPGGMTKCCQPCFQRATSSTPVIDCMPLEHRHMLKCHVKLCAMDHTDYRGAPVQSICSPITQQFNAHIVSQKFNWDIPQMIVETGGRERHQTLPKLVKHLNGDVRPIGYYRIATEIAENFRTKSTLSSGYRVRGSYGGHSSPRPDPGSSIVSGRARLLSHRGQNTRETASGADFYDCVPDNMADLSPGDSNSANNNQNNDELNDHHYEELPFFEDSNNSIRPSEIGEVSGSATRLDSRCQIDGLSAGPNRAQPSTSSRMNNDSAHPVSPALPSSEHPSQVVILLFAEDPSQVLTPFAMENNLVLASASPLFPLNTGEANLPLFASNNDIAQALTHSPSPPENNTSSWLTTATGSSSSAYHTAQERLQPSSSPSGNDTVQSVNLSMIQSGNSTVQSATQSLVTHSTPHGTTESPSTIFYITRGDSLSSPSPPEVTPPDSVTWSMSPVIVSRPRSVTRHQSPSGNNTVQSANLSTISRENSTVQSTTQSLVTHTAPQATVESPSAMSQAAQEESPATQSPPEVTPPAPTRRTCTLQ